MECVGGVCGWCVVDVGIVCGCSVKCDMTVCFTRDAHTLLELCSHAGVAASCSFIR